MNSKLQTIIAIHQSGDLEQAEPLYLKLLEAQPENTDILHLLGILNAQKKNFEKALAYIKHAIELNPKAPSFYNSLGNIYKNKKHWDKAVEAYYHALELNPSNAQTLNNLGNLLYDQKKYPDAISHYRSALKLKPHSPDTLCNLGIALKAQGDAAASKKTLEKVIEMEPHHPVACMELGRMAHLAHDYEAAITYYQNCLKSDPSQIEALNNLGVIFLEQDKLSAAIEVLKKALAFNPTHVESLTNLGNIYLKNQSLNEALSCYLRLLEVQPDFDVYYNLGVIYMYKEHHQSAIEYFQKARGLKPDDLNLHINLGSIYLKMENPEKAVEHYKAALKKSPDHPEIRYLLAALTSENHTFQAAPDVYIQSLFDQYAPYFDVHLKEYLHYRTPQELFKAVTEYTGIQNAQWNILDLGCGTGLCGPLFRPLAKYLVGIDLSTKMIKIAEKKNCYDLLKNQSIEEALPSYQNMDLILSADVLPYIGALESLFKQVNQALKPEGLFAFTTENTFLNDFVLQSSARFAHHPKYIEALASQLGLDCVVSEKTLLREQKKQPLEGHLWIFKKPVSS